MNTRQLGWTSLEQSKKLIKAGLDPNTADMFYLYNYNLHKHNNTPDTLIIHNWNDPYNKSIPCWSLAALLELMPIIKDNDGSSQEHRCMLYKDFEDVLWHCNYGIYLHSTKGKTPIDAAVKMIIWLKEQKYI